MSVYQLAGKSRWSATVRWLFVVLLVGLSVSAAPQQLWAQVFTDNQFSSEVVASLGTSAPTGIAWSPDGRMFVLQKNGIVRIVKNGSLVATPFLDFSAQTNIRGDLGLLGVAFHPDFTHNGWIYFSYVYEPSGTPTATGKKMSRVVRVTANPANPDVMLAGSELIILGAAGTTSCDALPATADCMPADETTSTIGTLRFAADGKLFVSNGDGANPAIADPNALRAQNLDSLGGKILRVNDDGSAPLDNPFYDGTNSNKSKVWAYGVRNPYRFGLHPTSGEPWAGDIGSTFQEVDRIAKGANLGWPCYEGAGTQPLFSAFGECAALGSGSVLAPFFAYDNTVGTSVVGGAFYTGTVYPQTYRDSFYFGDANSNGIRRIIFNSDGSASVSVFATGIDSPAAIEVGPDGHLYYVSRVSGDIRRIKYNGPTAVASVFPRSGYSPLAVNFSSFGSKDASGGTALTYLWDFGDATTSTAANPAHTYAAGGTQTFTAQLTVTATSNGAQSSVKIPVTLGSQPPAVTITTPSTGTVTVGQVVSYQGFASDPDQGTLPDAALTWTILVHHNTHDHVIGTTTGPTGSLTIENQGLGAVAYELVLTATDSSGLTASKSVVLTIPNTSGAPTAPGTPVATAASTSRIDLSWTPSTGPIGIASYRVERCTGTGCTNFIHVGTSYGPSFSDSSLAGATTYVFRVRAVDAASSLSPYSNSVQATTQTPAHMVGLVAAYSFSEGAGTTSVDKSGNGNNASLGTTGWNAAGKFGSALAFTGSQYATVADANSLDLTNAMTLEAWVYPTATPTGWTTVLLKEQPGELIYGMYGGQTGTNRPTGWGFVGTSVPVTGTAALATNAWTHLATTYDGTTLRLYVNGVQVATQALSGSFPVSSGALRIGGNAVWPEFFTGRIDEVRIFNRVLNVSEIAADMNRPVDQDVAVPTAPQTLTATAVNSSRIDLAWFAAADDIGVASYEIERCLGADCSVFVKIGTAITTSYSDSVAPGSTYVYRVRATDAALNVGGYSPTATASAPDGPDSAPPTTPGGLTASVMGTSQVNLAWGAATDNIGVNAYRVERCTGASCTSFVEIGTATTAAYSDTTVAGATTYLYRVRAADAAVNLSPYSNTVTAIVPDTTAPTAPATLTATAISGTQINLTWAAATDNIAVTGYRVERCAGVGCTTFAQIATPTTTTYSDTTVAGSTTYLYRVRAVDAAVNLGAYSPTATATTPDITAPSAPATLTATAISISQVNLAWVASTDNVAVTGYRVERCAGVACTNFAEIAQPVTNAYSDLTVAGSTTYIYRVRAVDAAANLSGYSNTASATTPDVTAPSAPGTLSATAPSGTQVNLTWIAATDNVAVSGYGVERCTGVACSDFAQIGAPATNAFSDTTVALTTAYSYRVRAVDAALNVGAYSNTASLTTPGADAVPPSAPGALTATTLSDTQINLSWGAATDNVGIGGYRVERCAGVACTAFAEIATSAAITYSDTTVSNGTTYGYRVRAVDTSTNLGPYTNTAVATTPDSAAPSAPGTLAGTAPSSAQVNLTWVASTDNVGVTGYRIERCTGAGCATFAQIGTSVTNAYNDTTAVASTAYSYRVRAMDAAVNLSVYSNSASVTTPAPPDTTAPSAPGTLGATVIGGTQINLSWGVSTDNVAVTGYRIERCSGAACTTFAQIGTSTTTAYNDTTVTGSTAYSYRVRAVDAAVNLGPYSNTATATTPDATPPSAPGSLTATAINGTQVNLAWGAATDNVAVTGYRIDRCSGAACATFAEIATSATATYSDTTVTNAVTYGYRVRAVDAAVNLGPYSNTATVSTPDTTVPSAPGTLTATAISGTQISLAWGAATDNVAVTGYRVERCTGAGCTAFAQIATPATASYNDTTVASGTTYGYRVRAVDTAANLGVYSNTATATTPAVDAQAPTAPGLLTATLASGPQVNLAWSAATDNVAVTGYRVERCAGAGCTSFAQIGAPTGLAYNDTTVVASTTFLYRVRANDASGNLGPYSNTASVTTPSANVGLIAAYSFSEGTGTSTADASGNSHAGTITGAAWTTSGRFGNALNFTGSHMVTVNDTNLLDLTNGMTLEAWVYPTVANPTDWNTVILKETTGDLVYGMYAGKNGTNRPTGWGNVTSSTSVTGGAALATNAWTHMAVTYDGATLRLYVNGVQNATQALAGNLKASTGVLRIGGNAIWGEYFRGMIDEVRIYNRALDSISVQNDMNAPIDTGGVVDTTAPGAPATLTATAVTDSRIDLAWSAATDNVGVISYRVERCTGSGCSNFAQIGNTTVTTFADSTAAATTTYVYRVRASDAAVNLGPYSPTASATTPVAIPVTQGISATWKCNIPGCNSADWLGAAVDWPAWAAYSTNARTGVNSRTVYSDSGTLLYPYMGSWATGCTVTAVTGQALIIEWQRGTDVWRETLLSPGQSRTINLIPPENGAMIESLEGVRSFSVKLSNCNPQPIPDTTAPGAPGTLTATVAGSAQVNLSWGAATDNVAVTGYKIERCTGAGCTSFAQIGTSTGTTYSDTAVSPNTTYLYRVRANDAAGNNGPYSSTATATTLADTTAPGAPGTLTGSAVSTTQINLSWGAATDNVAVTGYRVERCTGAGCTSFAQIGTSTGTTYNDTAVVGNTTYLYRARANDAAGNLGAYTNTTTVTTPSGSDTTAPGTPGTLTGTAASSSQINLGWGAATDNVAVTGYRVERCTGAGCTSFAQIGTSASTTYNDTAVVGNTTYLYRVRANDAVGNLGPYSNTATATTPGAPPPGGGLVAAYGFNEGAGTTSVDSSGNGNSASLGSTTWNAAGKFGSALSFSGTQYTTINDSNSLDLTSAMTLEAWVYPTATPTDWTSLILKEQPGELVYAMYGGQSGSNRPTGWGFVSISTSVTGTAALANNTWSHLATTYDGTTLRLYVNGAQVATQALTGNLTTSTGALRVGGNAVWGEYFTGRIDEIRIYNRALSAAEITTDMNTPVP